MSFALIHLHWSATVELCIRKLFTFENIVLLKGTTKGCKTKGIYIIINYLLIFTIIKIDLTNNNNELSYPRRPLAL